MGDLILLAAGLIAIALLAWKWLGGVAGFLAGLALIAVALVLWTWITPWPLPFIG